MLAARMMFIVAPHAYLVQVYLGAVELAVGSPGIDKAAGDLHVGAQGGHALYVLVYGP